MSSIMIEASQQKAPQEELFTSLGGKGITTKEDLRVYEDFDSMGLKTEILRGIYSLGFENPSPVQSKAIIPCIQGNDVICQAQSGTGKTATFCTALLQRIDESSPTTQALVLSPTRELAKQTYEVASSLAGYTHVTIHCSVGGISVSQDFGMLRKRPHVIIGTPGRCLDSLQREVWDPSDVKLLVLDEMDVLLSAGFKEIIYSIFQKLPSDVQVILVSATMPPEALDVAHKFMRSPVEILVKTEAVTLSGIRQYFVMLDQEGHKFSTLCDLFGFISISQAVIFVNTVRKAEWLTNALDKEGFTVGMIHGQMDAQERSHVAKQFKQAFKKVLVATDVFARGIDVQGVQAVVNYDLPQDKENYIHRVGRCGRYGKKGFALNLITPDSVRDLQLIQEFYSAEIKELPEDFHSNF